MTRFVIYPSRVSNEEAQMLKHSFLEKGHHALIAKRDGVYQPKADDCIIGWGYSKKAVWDEKALGVKMFLNHPDLIMNSVNKLEAYERFRIEGVTGVPYCFSKAGVKKWLQGGHKVIGRQTITGKKAEGIVVIDDPKNIPDCLVYTRFIPSTKEYRVYMLHGELVDVLEKRHANGTDDSGMVKSEENGWVFCRQNVSLPESCRQQAVMALEALELDFGGVDVLWNKSKGAATVLEVNTAPGIFGSGVDKFTDAFIKLAA